ncbi:MAG: hypothetical protein ACRENQ_03715, partial [Gemmatimonadaceae bacterium]
MHRIACALALVACPSFLFAQKTVQPPDSAARADSVKAAVQGLNAVNIVAAPVDRSQPANVTHVSASMINITPSNSTLD